MTTHLTFKEKPGSMTPESKIYVYATEMVSEYYSRVNLQDKSVLTIIGSGDQILDAYFFGASHVIGFDINIRSPLFVELKIEAIKKMSYGEFLLFFGDTFDNGNLDHEKYLNLKSDLSDKAREFFDNVYKETEGKNPLKSEYFRNRSMINTSIKDVNAYLKDESSYMKMRSILETVKPQYVLGDIQDLASQFEKERFDVINMSNVLNYFVGRNKKRIILMLEVLQTLAHAVKKDGIIFFYSYSTSIYEDGAGPIASREDTKKMIENLGVFEISEVSFKGTNGVEPDRITILEKK